MISCNHFAITTTYLHGYLQIYCKKRFFHKKSTPTLIAENPLLVEQNLATVLWGAVFTTYLDNKKAVTSL